MSNKEKDHEKKKKKRLISIDVTTALDVVECMEVVNDCLKEIDLSKFEIISSFDRRSGMRVLGGEFTTKIVIIGEGWKGSVELVSECLERSGYYIQSILADHSIIPSKN